MPIFYFETVDGHLHEDQEGRELSHDADLDKELRHHLCEVIAKGDNPLRALVKVRNERRELVASATLSAAIDYPATHH